MERRTRKVWTIIFVLVFGMMVSGCAAIADESAAGASEGDPGYVALMEINDDNLISIAEELMTYVRTKQQHPDLYSVSTEITELSQETDYLFTESYEKVHVIPVKLPEILNSLIPPEEMEEYNIDDEILSMIDQRVGNLLINKMNSQMGADYFAFSSMITSSRSYVADLDQEILVILEYDDEYSLVADFFSSGEHVITATETIIPSEMVAELLRTFDAD